MINRETVALITTGAILLGSMGAKAQPAETTAQTLPELPVAGAPAPAVDATGLPALPVAPLGAMPTIPVSAAPAVPVFGTLPGATPAGVPVPTPPPIGNLDMGAASTMASDSSSTPSISGTSAAPSQLYSFLFIEDPDHGIVRHKFTADTANLLKENEIQRLLEKRRTQPAAPSIGMDFGMGGGFDPLLGASMDPALYAAGTNLAGGPTGAANNTEATRAAAEWDFYYDQLEMYDRYVREKLIQNTEEDDLPELNYDAANALQERQDLFESFQESAIEESNKDFNDNKAFYERLQIREDRRIAYRQWLLHRETQMEEWTEIWARNVYGNRWADGEEVRVDDWYYGTDFNSAKPVVVSIDNREFVVSRQPAPRLKEGQLNVISSNLTPYDIIDNNGYLKNPVMETLRGTVVIPPADPIYSTDMTTGTIEIIGSSY